jgi:phosphoglycolate phosphatase
MPSASNERCVVVDLDGPILDGRWRHYECYRQILSEHAHQPLSIETYWSMKRRGTCMKDQLAATGAEAIYNGFKAAWLARIEAPEMLALDQLQPGAAETLKRWRRMGHVRLVLATLRQREDGVIEQVERFNLAAVWDAVVVCSSAGDGAEKARRVAGVIGRASGDQCVWIGDTEADVQAARQFGCPVWALTCGLRNEAFLAALAPDRLSESMSQIDLLYMPAEHRA